jgi:hypothetical protein
LHNSKNNKENNMALKHVGRVKRNNRKVVVAYRTLPEDGENCVVVTTENLAAEDHDALMKAVESDAGQSAYEFAECMARTTLPDGSNMLSRFHTTGKMVKLETSAVEMTPDRVTVIGLDVLNNTIAEQKGVTVNDLALKGPTTQNKPDTAKMPVVEDVAPAAVTEAATDGVLSDEDLARSYRSQADRLSKEAAELRRQAEALVPTKKAKKESVQA